MPAVGAPAHRVHVELDLAHALDAAGEDDVGDAGLHLHSGEADRLEAGAAAAVELEARHLHRQAGGQRGDAADGGRLPVGVAVPEDAVLDDGGVYLRAFQDGGDHDPRQGFRVHVSQRAAVAPDGCAHGAADYGLSHLFLPFQSSV